MPNSVGALHCHEWWAFFEVGLALPLVFALRRRLRWSLFSSIVSVAFGVTVLHYLSYVHIGPTTAAAFGASVSPQRPDDFILHAYDCGQPTAIVDMGFDHTAVCMGKRGYVQRTAANFVILQHERQRTTPGYRCTIKESRTVTYCGNYDHQTTLDAYQHFGEEITVSVAECTQIRTQGTYSRFGYENSVNKQGHSRLHIMQVGSSYVSSGMDEVHCQGGDWKPPGAHRPIKGVVVSIHLQISVFEEQFQRLNDLPQVRAVSADVNLPCSFTALGCSTAEGAFVWTAYQESCPLARSREASGHTVQDEDHEVFISTDGSMIRLILYESVTMPDCPKFLVRRTNYEDIYVSSDPSALQVRPLGPSEQSMAYYVRNRDDYLYHHLMDKIEAEFRHVVASDCKARARQLKLEYFLQHNEPRLYSWLMGNGTFGLAAGEVIYQYTCPHVLVRARETEGCFHELPVTVITNGSRLFEQEMFLDPLTRTLFAKGTVVPCNPRFLAKFRNHRGDWISAAPELRRAEAPTSIARITEVTETLHQAARLDPSTGGLYADSAIRENDLRLGWAREVLAANTRLVGQSREYHIPGATPIAPWDVLPGLPPASWSALIWSFLHTWGEVAAVLVACHTILSFVATIIGKIVQMGQLGQIVGCSSRLLYALCLDVILLRTLPEEQKARLRPRPRTTDRPDLAAGQYTRAATVDSDVDVVPSYQASNHTHGPSNNWLLGANLPNHRPSDEPGTEPTTEPRVVLSTHPTYP